MIFSYLQSIELAVVSQLSRVRRVDILVVMLLYSVNGSYGSIFRIIFLLFYFIIRMFFILVESNANSNSTSFVLLVVSSSILLMFRSSKFLLVRLDSDVVR